MFTFGVVLLLFHLFNGVFRQRGGVAEAHIGLVRGALGTTLVQNLTHQVTLEDLNRLETKNSK